MKTSIHLRSGDAATVDCGLHRNDERLLLIDKIMAVLFLFVNKTKRADEAATDYAKTIPNTKQEQTYKDIIKIDLNGKIVEGKRRHDIIQTNALGELKAIEVKDYRSSKVYLSEDIKREALMDIELLKDKDNKVKEVEWVFKVNGKNGEPSAPLRAFLESNGIRVKII